MDVHVGKMLGKKKPASKPVDPDKWYPGKLMGKPAPQSDRRDSKGSDQESRSITSSGRMGSTQSASMTAVAAQAEYQYEESEHLMSVRRGKM